MANRNNTKTLPVGNMVVLTLKDGLKLNLDSSDSGFDDLDINCYDICDLSPFPIAEFSSPTQLYNYLRSGEPLRSDEDINFLFPEDLVDDFVDQGPSFYEKEKAPAFWEHGDIILLRFPKQKSQDSQEYIPEFTVVFFVVNNTPQNRKILADNNLETEKPENSKHLIVNLKRLTKFQGFIYPIDE